MSKQPSRRARASPVAALVERKCIPLSEFVHRVGAAVYGTEWRFKSTASLPFSLSENRTVGSEEDLAWFVCDQILLALQAGMITAVVPLIVSKKALAVQQPEPVDELEDDDPRTVPNPQEDDSAPKLKLFKISSVFWAEPFNPEKLDWNTSRVSVDATHLFEDGEVAKPSMRASDRRFRQSKANATRKKKPHFWRSMKSPRAILVSRWRCCDLNGHSDR